MSNVSTLLLVAWLILVTSYVAYIYAFNPYTYIHVKYLAYMPNFMGKYIWHIFQYFGNSDTLGMLICQNCDASEISMLEIPICQKFWYTWISVHHKFQYVEMLDFWYAINFNTQEIPTCWNFSTLRIRNSSTLKILIWQSSESISMCHKFWCTGNFNTWEFRYIRILTQLNSNTLEFHFLKFWYIRNLSSLDFW